MHSLDYLVCDIKGKSEQAMAIQKEFSQSCVKTRFVLREQLWFEDFCVNSGLARPHLLFAIKIQFK